MSRYNRYSTIRTHPVTTFSYFYICIMRRRCQYTFQTKVRHIFLSQIIQQFIPIELSVKLIDFRNLSCKLGHETFRQASHYIKLFDFFLCFCRNKIQNHIDRFFFGIAYKPTGIDHHNLSRYFFCIMPDFISGRFELPHKMFRIHQIFRTS